MLIDGIRDGLGLLFALDPELWDSIRMSVLVSSLSTLIAASLSLPLALGISRYQGWGKGLVSALLGTAQAMPTVLVGLLGYAMLARQGPLGWAGLLYTPWAMVAGQVVLAVPLMTGIAAAALEQTDPRVLLTVLGHGGTRLTASLMVLRAGRVQLITALAAGFGRVFSEVGVSMMLGGNIRGETRNITTGIAFETSRGEFGRGVALGLVLLVVALSINLLVRARTGKAAATGRVGR